jgi:hypothetical protein
VSRESFWTATHPEKLRLLSFLHQIASLGIEKEHILAYVRLATPAALLADESEEGAGSQRISHFAVLMSKRVFLDLDDLSANSRDSYGRLIFVAYLTGSHGQPIVAPNFNILLLDSGHAKLEKFTNNEFDPQDLRSGPRQVFQTEAEPLRGLGAGLAAQSHRRFAFPGSRSLQERSWTRQQKRAGIG